MESTVRRYQAQAYATRSGQPPLFIAIDQEGGVVARLKPPFTQFPGNPAMVGVEDAIAFAQITAKELNSIGVNMNMAPVLDVAPDASSSVMCKRVFVGDPQKVALMGVTVIDHLQAHGIIAVGKHFPGIGRTVLDSHEDLPELDIAPEILASSDLVPFMAAADAEVGGLMLSHIRYPRLDPIWPASLSPAIAHDLLRGQIGFEGLVLTDDLDMGAIAKHYDLATIVNQCLASAVDILLICHSSPKIAEAHQAILEKMDATEALWDQSEASVARIMAAKHKFLAT
ncbi:MAG: glycoside hydrolase family 3 protein [Desulfobacterales bacterium]|nr:glycoside hydrolase family 3 protein [Desulfobacterales bacterium]